MNRPLCIYHGNCADGFGAAWVVRRFFNGKVDFHPGVYGKAPPDVAGRDVIMVDFSYKRPVLDAMAVDANTILILDHHKTAAEDLAGFPMCSGAYSPVGMLAYKESTGAPVAVHAVFDMERSGAGLAWDFFFPGEPRPRLIDHIEDRDLWRFALPETRAIQADVFSFPYDFEVWDGLMAKAENAGGRSDMIVAGMAIDRKMFKDIAEILGVATRDMVIGGFKVPVVNLPYTMASEAAGKLAETAPFGASYFDRADARVFSLRSRGPAGVDVSEIAKLYGGGGHRNAAGFERPIGWEGDQ